MSQNLLAGIPLIGGFFDDSDQKARDQLAANQQLYNGIQLPKFKDYNPEQYKYLQDYAPEDYSANQIHEDPLAKSAQQSALAKMANLSNVGLSPQDEQGFQNARSMAGQISRSGNAAALQNADARHVGGGGLEYAMREQAGQDAAERAQQGGLAQAAQGANQRALYNQAFLQGQGQLRSQDFQANSANTDILNRFNQMNTSGHNYAQQTNQQGRQSAANQNVGNANSAQQYNNQMQQQSYQDAMSRAAGISGANTGMAQGYAAENAANTATRNQNPALAASAVMPGAGAASSKSTAAPGSGFDFNGDNTSKNYNMPNW